MKFIGVDLAWGRHNWTGLCLAEDGRVVESHLARSDQAILDWLRPRSAGPCLVGIDAPLILRNRTGSRPCEKALNRCFRRFEAGCYPANTTRVPLRAARLVAELGLDPDPVFRPRSRVRRAVEVFPHVALVALFGLPKTLKYKAKRGRTAGSRHKAFSALVGLLKSLAGRDPALDVTTAPRWAKLEGTVTTESSGARLDRAEDELDAFVCAYIAAHLWAHGSARNRIVGDTDTGYIVTPVTPELAACLDRS
jgi:predicted RNase H-like nuclease